MKQVAIAFALGLCTALAFAQDAQVEHDKPAADQGRDEARKPDDATSEKSKDKEFKPPPGFKSKKRGKYVLYCKTDTTVGTRFKTEKCYNEAQMRDYLIWLQEQKTDVDRIRATCSNGTPGGPCAGG